MFFAHYNYNNYDDTWALDKTVHQHTFSKPVLDFSVSSSERGTNRIWVAIDHTFSFSGITPTAVSTGTASRRVDHATETNIGAATAAVINAEPADISSPEYVNSSTLRLLEWNGGDKVDFRCQLYCVYNVWDFGFGLAHTDRFVSPLIFSSSLCGAVAGRSNPRISPSPMHSP